MKETIKKILKNDKALIFTILILIIACIYWNVQNNNLKVALNEANQESSIEIAKNKLDTLEGQWKEYEDKKNYCVNTIQVMNEYKAEIEPRIQEQREFIL